MSAVKAFKGTQGLASRVIKPRYTFLRVVRRERTFLLLLGVCFFAAGAAYPYPGVAMWVGFALAAYSTIANDSIQTLGTFIASNRRRPWWLLWLFIGGVFVLATGYSWLAYGGDVSSARLSAKGFADASTSFSFLQVAAPLFLLILTRLRMPVSTTFLILSCFATDLSGVGAMLVKSVSGYGVAFGVALGLWWLAARVLRALSDGAPAWYWMPLQWASTAFLWATWIMQDAANIAVYLPRSLSAGQFAVFAGFVFVGLGLLFYLRGDRIQQVVEEKSDVLDVRPATIIDFTYALVLFGFKEVSVIPMSTTWVFIGLLAGRELAMSLGDYGGKGLPLAQSLRLARRDVVNALIGLAVSIALALATNPDVMAALWR